MKTDRQKLWKDANKFETANYLQPMQQLKDDKQFKKIAGKPARSIKNSRQP